jgi:hypothetical protein
MKPSSPTEQLSFLRIASAKLGVRAKPFKMRPQAHLRCRGYTPAFFNMDFVSMKRMCILKASRRLIGM